MRRKATAVMLSVMTIILAIALMDSIVNRGDPVPHNYSGLVVAIAVLLVMTAILTVISVRMAMNEVPDGATDGKTKYLMPLRSSEPTDVDATETATKGKMPREGQ